MKSVKIISVIMLTIALWAVINAISTDKPSELKSIKDQNLYGNEKNDELTIKIALNDWAGYAPIIYADILGLYKKNHLPVKIKFINNPDDVLNLYKKNQLDAMPIVVADALALLAESGDGKIVLLTDYSKEGDAIITNKKYKSIKDLKGKTFGINQLNSFSHFFTLEAIQEAGLSERDVQFKIIPYDEIQQALDKKIIDAGHTWNPAKKIAVSAGYHMVFQGRDAPGIISEGIIFHEDYLKKHKELVKKFIDVFYQAQEEMYNNPKKAAGKMQSFFKNNPDEFAESFKEMHFINKEESNFLMDKKNEQSYVLKYSKVITQFLTERGQTQNLNLYKDLMAQDFLK